MDKTDEKGIMTSAHHDDHPCAGCGHTVTARNWSSDAGDQRTTLCKHPTGAKQQQPGCAWRTDGATMRLYSNRVFG